LSGEAVGEELEDGVGAESVVIVLVLIAGENAEDAGPEGARHWNGRAHFFRAAADALRRILVDRAREKHSQKRGGAWRQVDLDQAAGVVHDPSEDVAAVSEALDLLAEHDPVKAELVKLRFFAGLSVEEAADLLGISRATADRYWRYAKTWLYCALTRQSEPEAE
jgi:RNA polymerase sigma factor (TIGR02999 family)